MDIMGCERMKTERQKIASRVLKGLRDMHRNYLIEAMQNDDVEYARIMNEAFELFERLENE